MLLLFDRANICRRAHSQRKGLKEEEDTYRGAFSFAYVVSLGTLLLHVKWCRLILKKINSINSRAPLIHLVCVNIDLACSSGPHHTPTYLCTFFLAYCSRGAHYYTYRYMFVAYRMASSIFILCHKERYRRVERIWLRGEI